MNPFFTSEDEPGVPDIREERPESGAARYFSESRGQWFSGLPRAGRWREILGRFRAVRDHRDDPMRVLEFRAEGASVRSLCVEIVDRRADTIIRLRHAGEPFTVRHLD